MSRTPASKHPKSGPGASSSPRTPPQAPGSHRLQARGQTSFDAIGVSSNPSRRSPSIASDASSSIIEVAQGWPPHAWRPAQEHFDLTRPLIELPPTPLPPFSFAFGEQGPDSSNVRPVANIQTLVRPAWFTRSECTEPSHVQEWFPLCRQDVPWTQTSTLLQEFNIRVPELYGFLYNLEGALLSSSMLTLHWLRAGMTLVLADLVGRGVFVHNNTLQPVAWEGHPQPRWDTTYIHSREAFQSQRWHVWVVYFERHWTLLIGNLDRKAPEFTLYDSWRAGRDGRLQQTKTELLRFANAFGMREAWINKAQWHIAPVRQQEQEWECGVLVLENLRAAFRHQRQDAMVDWNKTDNAFHGSFKEVRQAWVQAIRYFLHDNPTRVRVGNGGVPCRRWTEGWDDGEDRWVPHVRLCGDEHLDEIDWKIVKRVKGRGVDSVATLADLEEGWVNPHKRLVQRRPQRS